MNKKEKLAIIKEAYSEYVERYLDDGIMTEEAAIDFITEDKALHEDGDIEHHRWYSLQKVVVQLPDGKHIQYPKILTSGDLSLEDLGEEYHLEDFNFVEPFMETVISYRLIK